MPNQLGVGRLQCHKRKSPLDWRDKLLGASSTGLKREFQVTGLKLSVTLSTFSILVEVEIGAYNSTCSLAIETSVCRSQEG